MMELLSDFRGRCCWHILSAVTRTSFHDGIPRQKQRILYWILFFFFSLLCLTVNAQQPVQVNTLLRPPYSLQLSDYYTSTQEKLVVTLTNRDLNKPVLNVRLRLTIESQGVKLRSRDFADLPALPLEAGIPLRLSLGDLAPYFNADNLDFSGITRAQ